MRADPGEIGRAIMNLALNARDAMPDGGTLTIGTANVTMTEGMPGSRAAPGRYVTMAVHDTGVGIDADVRAHIFEPFFTTKERKRNGPGSRHRPGNCRAKRRGHPVRVATGRGNNLHHFLAGSRRGGGQGTAPGRRPCRAPKGSEVILLVEDEETVRKLARQDPGGERIRGTRSQQRTGRSGAVRNPPRARSICWCPTWSCRNSVGANSRKAP